MYVFIRRTASVTRILAVLLVCLVMPLVPDAFGQTADEMVEDARIKMKLKDYGGAESVLKEASKKFPSSIDVARTCVELHEQTGNSEALIKACGKLVELLQLKEVKQGKLDEADGALLKETESKLRELVEIRWDTDAAVRDFVKSGIEACRKLTAAKKLVCACFVYQRLAALETREEEVKKLAQAMGEGNTELLLKPEDEGGDAEKAAKLVVEARDAFDAGKYEDASITCKAALEVDPCRPSAVSLLCDIMDKMGNEEDMFLYGLSYLLLPPQEQTARRAEEMERRMSRASDELKNFFGATKKAVAKIASLVSKAIREKKDSDQEYAMERLCLLTHRTRKLDGILSKSSSKPQTTRKTSKKLKNPVKTGKVLLSDNYSVNNNMWYLRDGYAWIENGKYNVKSDQRIWLCRGPSDFQPGDFYVECEAELSGEDKDFTSGGICFRLQSGNNYYTFLVDTKGRCGVWVVKNGSKRDLTGKELEDTPNGSFGCGISSKYIKKGGAKNLVAVACVGNRIFCYVNRNLVWNGEDDTWLRGQLGCSVHGGNNQYAFDNYKVTEAYLGK